MHFRTPCPILLGMGQAILYCARCSCQLREAQFEQGKAYRIDNWVCCAQCAPEALRSLPPDRSHLLKAQIAGLKKKSSPAIEPIPASRPNIILPKPEPAAPPRNPWIIVGALAGAVVVLLLLFALRGGARSPEPEMEAPRVAPKPAAPESPARLALAEAKQYARDHPEDWEGQLKRFGDLALVGDRSEAGTEARKMVEALHAREEEMAGRLMAALEAEIAEPLKREEFGSVLRSLESAKTRMGGARWVFRVEKRDGEVRDQMRRLIDAMKTAACEAKKKGDKVAVQEATDRVRNWGSANLASEWATALAAVEEPPPPPPPPPPARSPEAAAYQLRWESAMARASARDFAGAMAEIQKAAQRLREKGVQDEAAQDLRDLQDAGRVYQSAVAALGSARTASLSSIDGRSLSGRVLVADGDRIELFVEPRKPTVFFEWSDVAAASLLRELSAEPRAKAILHALDGEIRGDELPPKYAAYASAAREKAVKPGADEIQARALFYDAERGFRVMSSREKSIEAYRTLKQKYRDTALVRHAAARIDRRIESGREYFFLASDLSATGTFALTREGRLESIADSDPQQEIRNGAEWEYLALPSQTYRCWALVGGCCAEAFAFHYQATGLTEMNPKTRKRGPAEPGGELASPVKHSIKNLKSHPKGEPKKPTRWEWVEILLPRPAGPGVKKIRLLTDQQGFSVAQVMVSSTRARAPSEAEAVEFAKVRALDATPPWAVDRPGVSARIVLDDFEKEPSGWKYIGGQEFPGAVGSLAYDTSTAHEGKGSYRLIGDFAGGGGYVGTWRDLPARDFKELRIWIKAVNLKVVMVRMVDATDQCHQRDIPISPLPDWQELVLTFPSVAGAQHWGGANDGVWHGQAKAYGLNIANGHFVAGPPKGTLWIDDIEGVLADDPSDR